MLPFSLFFYYCVPRCNVYHLYTKVHDLWAFYIQSTPSCILFDITESRLDSRISDQDINILNYCISKKDSLVIGQTAIAVYIHSSIADITHRRKDLESDLVECIWLELKPNNIFVVIYVYTHTQKPFCFL